MILINDVLHPNFKDYKIDIPIADDRASKAYLKLQEKYPKLKSIGFNPTIKISKEDLLRVHTKDFVKRVLDSDYETIKKAYELTKEKEEYNLEKFISDKLLQTSGTYQAAVHALKDEFPFCFFLGGGMHHAMTMMGRGFCMIHDVIIAIRKMQSEGLIKTAWIIDVDAHKGDGAAQIARDDATITTFSIHMGDSWPLLKDDPDFTELSMIPSDIDVPIFKGEDHLYINKLNEGLKTLKDNFKKPDIAFVVDGSDPYELDELKSTANLKLPLETMLERDMTVFKFLYDQYIPQSYVIAGGYGANSWRVYYQFLDAVIKFRSSQL